MNKRLPTILGLVITMLAVWALITSNHFVRDTISRLNDLGYDLQLKTYIARRNPQPSPSIVIVDIDDRSLEVEGRWPWPRDKVAALTDILQKQGASVIAFDMFFSEDEVNPIENFIQKLGDGSGVPPKIISQLKERAILLDNDTILAKSLENTNAVLSIAFLPKAQEQNILPTPIITLTDKESAQFDIPKAKGYITSTPVIQTAAKNAGFINIFADTDGIFRHAPLIIEYKKNLYPSLALQAVLSYYHTTAQIFAPNYGNGRELEGIQVGLMTVPVDLKGQALIPFIGKSYTFPYYNATDVLHQKIPSNVFKGKIVFVGTSATGLGDLKATAIQNPFPGVEIQATMANGILTDDFSSKPGWTFGADIVLTFLLGIITSFVFPRLGPKGLGAIIVFVPTALLFLNNWIWETSGLILSFMMPVTLILVSAIFNMIYGYLFESNRRQRLKEMFGQYVPAKHIDEMLQTSSEFALRGEDREMSVLFADIRGFTNISEGLTAAQLVELLNTFFTPMTEIIFKNSGTIDKYVGDLIMAFWGAPLKDKHHARHAIQTALSMQKKAKELAAFAKEKNWPEIKIGIGISSGIMSVGDMGSQYRRNYTVLGDNVNLGSRVESLTKFYGARIIVTEVTQHNQPKFVFRKLDRVRVKGRLRGIEIYEVLCGIEKLTPDFEKSLAQYHSALDAYFAQRWDEAYELMNALHLAHPHTKIYKIYLNRIKHYKRHPLSEDWDGVYVHLTK